MKKLIDESYSLNDKMHWYHWAVVTASIIITLSAWHLTSRQSEQKKQLQFDFQAKQIVELVIDRMNKYEQALWSGVAAIHSQSYGMSMQEWQRFSQVLSLDERYPGINGIGVIYYVTKANREKFLAEQKSIRPEFSIQPIHNNDEYWPITYVEPIDINRQAIGLDIAHEKNRYTAAKKSRDTGTAQITGPIILVQDAKKTPGFLFYVPYYQGLEVPKTETQKRQKFIGLVYAPFIMEKLMKGTLHNTDRLVNYSIHDEQVILYDEIKHNSVGYNENPLFSKNVSIAMYGRQWRVEVQSSDLFNQQQDNKQPLLILFSGLVINMMLLGLFLLHARSNKKVNILAKEFSSNIESSEHRLKITINNMSDGLLTVDKNCKVLTANQSFLDMFLYRESEIIGGNLTLLKIENSYSNLAAEIFGNAKSNFIAKRKILRVLMKSQHALPVEVSLSHVTSEKDEYYIITFRDLSLKLEAEREMSVTQGIMEAAINSSPTGFAIIDKKRTFSEANQALHQWLGFYPEKLIGMDIVEIFPISETDKVSDLIESLFNDKKTAFKIEYQFEKFNGQLVWGMLSAATVKDNQGYVAYIVIQVVDIQKERELLESLRWKNQALEKSNSDLEQFAYIASHDLKSPLNAISKLADWITEDCENILPEKSLKHLKLLVERSVRMRSLLEDLLSYSRVNQLTYEPETVELREIVLNQFDLLDKPKEFICECMDITLEVPRIPLEIIIRNIISNAIKHCAEKTIKIEVTCEIKGDLYQINITDNGPGIPFNMHEKVFEMFQTMKSRDDVEGSGMGLAMVRRILNHYLGEIKLVSEVNLGSTFTIYWPIKKTIVKPLSSNKNELVFKANQV